MSLKEYIATAFVIFFLVVLSETKLRIGMDKFDQLACSAHLKKIYSSLMETISEDPEIFTKNPNTEWYKCLKEIDQANLNCPSAIRNLEHGITGYALNNTIYEALKNGEIKNKEYLAEKYSRKMLIMDSENDPTGFFLFPMVNPSFRHNGGCNMMLTNGAVIWCDRDDFVSDNFNCTNNN